MNLEKDIIETRRAIGNLNQVSHISWSHYKDGEFDVKLHFSGDRIIQRMSKDDLDILKDNFKNLQRKETMVDRLELQDSIGELFLENGFLEHPRKWSVDLSEVEFISFKQNDENFTYFVKLHIKAKEIRLYLGTMEEVEQLIEIWKQYR
tara:strand:+ start:18592 stop:19038 length:447 start_codon:yes stop_codon:yes gene_type:complete